MRKLFKRLFVLIVSFICYSQSSVSQSVTIIKAEEILNSLLRPYAESKNEWFTAVDTLRNYNYSISNFFEQFGTNESNSTINRHHVISFNDVGVPGNKIVLSSSVHKTKKNNLTYTYIDAWTSVYMETQDFEVYDMWIKSIRARNISSAQSHPFEFSFPQHSAAYVYKYYIITFKTNYENKPPNLAAKKPSSYSIEFFYCMNPISKPPTK